MATKLNETTIRVDKSLSRTLNILKIKYNTHNINELLEMILLGDIDVKKIDRKRLDLL